MRFGDLKDVYFACKFSVDNDNKRLFNIKEYSGVESWEATNGAASFWEV
jgi:hypothetical protein